LLATRRRYTGLYRLVYRKLSGIFTGIAPPPLQEIARRVGEAAKKS